MSGYPVLLEGESIRALVVGGGAVAVRKVGALLVTHALVRVVATRASDAMRALGEQHGCTLDERAYRTEDLDGATLAIAATDDREQNAAVGRDARARGMLVNVADAPAEGTFVTVATHRAGDVTIAVSAGGVPAAAARLRDAIAARFDARYAEAVHALGAMRARLLAAGDRDGWERAQEALITDQFCARVESGLLLEDVAAWH
ncbi:MAG: precorrin-2 dehydrogenase/sirohydrochlorin ferrochelatase family protein [Gemmatimonadaceae bacterium]